ncbi:hypothetical protein H8S95_10180 [Pontibacter sp. KCTC 32443]|uniref:hypothetical protein n=1 Tax=Pontibacter TaxID=323449 RepID=UPI00164D16E6|nr:MULTISPECIES: hypothetical protein [Pontibacter]MBC5774429.1 hypothetical protein [Pontibacter sp. KCTC 32443]
MKKQLVKILPLVATAALLSFTACQKTEDEIETVDTETVESETLAEMEFNTMGDFVEEAGNEEALLNGRVAATSEAFPACATRTFNAETRTLTIDFGTTNCVCRDGRSRRGKIVAVFEGQRHTAGSSVTITLQDYYVNDMHFTGTKTKTYVNANEMNVVVRDARIVTPKGNLEWSAVRVVERIAGTDTRLLTDDIYQITGRSTGLNRRGIKFNTEIEQPLKLVMAQTCVRNFVAGLVRTTTENGHTMVLDYDPIGGEPCDKIAELTINNRSRRIELR